MRKKVSIILIRHGETEENKRGAYIGCRTDSKLSQPGEEKIQEKRDNIIGLLSGEPHIWSSPMSRCIDTAKAIYSEIEAVVLDEFKEIDFGDFEGLNYDDLKGNPYYQSWIDSGGLLPFPGGEGREDFITRSYAGFESVVSYLIEKSLDKKCCGMIVAHGGTIMAIMSRLTGDSYFDFQVKNLEGYDLEISLDDGEIVDLSYNRI